MGQMAGIPTLKTLVPTRRQFRILKKKKCYQFTTEHTYWLSLQVNTLLNTYKLVIRFCGTFFRSRNGRIQLDVSTLATGDGYIQPRRLDDSQLFVAWNTYVLCSYYII